MNFVYWSIFIFKYSQNIVKWGDIMAKEEVGMLKRQIRALNEKLHDVKDQTSDYISENPMKSTVLAFGIGIVAGAVLMKLLERK